MPETSYKNYAKRGFLMGLAAPALLFNPGALIDKFIDIPLGSLEEDAERVFAQYREKFEEAPWKNSNAEQRNSTKATK